MDQEPLDRGNAGRSDRADARRDAQGNRRGMSEVMPRRILGAMSRGMLQDTSGEFSRGCPA